MRNAMLVAGLLSVMFADMGMAGTPAVTDIRIMKDTGLRPITAMMPPLSESEIRQRCRGFVRAISLRDSLARAMGRDSFQAIAGMSLPLESDPLAADFVTPYMVAFGPVNPTKTARSGLFRADSKTCTEVFSASE